MKILVLSNVLGSVDSIVDLLQGHHNVIAKEANMAESTMAGTAADQLRERAYDQVIVVAKDPIQAGMLLNKKEGVDAAVCGSVEDVQLARSNGANAIVIRDIRSDLLQDIIAEATGGGVLRGLKVSQSRAPERTAQQQARATQTKAQQEDEPAEPRAPLFKMPAFRLPQLLNNQQGRTVAKRATPGQKKTKQAAPQEEEEPPRAPLRSGSIKDKIKDYLGII